jgi:hypothetical protein
MNIAELKNDVFWDVMPSTDVSEEGITSIIRVTRSAS